MPAADVQGSLDFPSTPSMPYNAPEDQLLSVGRTRSLPIGESSQGPSFGRRTQSESSLIFPGAIPVLRSHSAADNAVSIPVNMHLQSLLTWHPSALQAPEQSSGTDVVPSALQTPEQPASAPSPVPTEIIPPDLTQEEIVADIQQLGIRVRDFAHEQFPVEMLAPELFDPILGWHVYEALLDNPSPKRSPLNGKHLRRLLDLGWVSEEADGHRWQEKDREALENFDSRPHYLWKALNLTKPRKHDLRGVATTRFQWVNAEQLVPQFVNRGISRVAAVFRGSRQAAARYQKRHANDATDTEEGPEVSPRSKKRRLSTGAESAPSGSQSASNSPADFPLTFINGKPPQQFPAGHPSDSPPRPTPLPTQGALSRSLQRHLSMTSVSSPDSRTTLTQSTNPE